MNYQPKYKIILYLCAQKVRILNSSQLTHIYYMIPFHNKRIYLRLINCIILAVACVAFVSTVFIFDKIREEKVQMECDQKVMSDFSTLINAISLELQKAKQPVIDFVEQMGRDTTFNYRDEKQVYGALEKMLEDNQELSGAVMAFEDWVYPQYAEHNGFGALIRREATGLVSFQVGESRDFRHLNQWYNRQIQGDLSADWSKPFFSDDSVMISTFSVPIMENDKFAGSIGADIDLTPLAEQIEKYRPYPTSIVAMINEDLDLLIHPNRWYIGNVRLDEAMTRVGINPKMHPLYHSKDRQGGVTYDYMGGRRIAFLYIPIPDTHWMCILYCPTEEIYEAVRFNQIIFIVIGSIGLIVLGTIFGIQIHKLITEYKKLTTFNGNSYEDFE